MRYAFTLIELMIVIAIIAIIAAIAIPNLLESRITANESAAAASLKSGIFPAQVQFQSGSYSDIDSNGRGEYAVDHRFLAGATAAATTGTTGKALSLLSPNFNTTEGNPVGSYQYKIDICTSPGTLSGDQVYGESFFAAYGAPNTAGSDGRRAFGINSFGIVYSTKQTLALTDITLAKISYGATTAATAVPPAAPAATSGAAGTKPIFVSDPTVSNASINSTNAAPFQK